MARVARPGAEEAVVYAHGGGPEAATLAVHPGGKRLVKSKMAHTHATIDRDERDVIVCLSIRRGPWQCDAAEFVLGKFPAES